MILFGRENLRIWSAAGGNREDKSTPLREIEDNKHNHKIGQMLGTAGTVRKDINIKSHSSQ